MSLSLDECRQVAEHFQIEGSIESIESYGSGHINDTFLIRTQETSADNYILQRINKEIFKNIPELMNNVVRVTQHLRKKLASIRGANPKRESLHIVLTDQEQPLYIDHNQDYWRTYIFISDTVYYDVVPNRDIAYKGGRAFGLFQRLLADLPSPPLHETIVDFHNIDSRLDALDYAYTQDRVDRAAQVSSEIDFVLHHAESMRTILLLGQEQKIPLRVTHNDTKFNNVLLSTTDDSACVIDLDTVMPGYVQYDFSDTVRTATNTAAEDEANLSKVGMNMQLFKGFAHGFLSEAASALNDIEIEQLSLSADLLPYIIGLRFLTDYLDGDRYFKIHFKEHNIQRARAQFQLVRSIQCQKSKMQEVITKFVREYR